MKALTYLVALVTATLSASAETLTIPQGAETRENTLATGFPFPIPGDISSQQVISSGFFPTLTEPGQFFQIDGIAFRLSCLGPDPFGANASFDRVEILVSSGNGPFTLDLSGNHGANQQIVFDSPLTLSGNVPPGTTPSLFDLAIQFETPFFYEKGTGALVVEIRKYGSSGLGAGLAAAEIPGTTFFIRSADGTETRGSIGPETQLNYQVVPEPSVSMLLGLGLFVLVGVTKRHKSHVTY